MEDDFKGPRRHRLVLLIGIPDYYPTTTVAGWGRNSFLVEGSDLDDNNYDGDIINTQWIMGLGSGV